MVQTLWRWVGEQVGLNGRGGSPPADPFEWAGALDKAAWVWVALAVLIATPFPLLGYPLPERATPILWLILGGTLCLFALVARTSVPFALLLAWALIRAWINSFPFRATQVLLLMALVGLLYGAARSLSPQVRRMVAWGFVVGLAYEWAFGVLNLFGHYPLMQFVLPEYRGRPMGFLTHVNYFGSFLALWMPLAWSLLGVPAALLVFILIAFTVSGGPVIAASAGALFLLWPEIGRRGRMAVAAGLGGTVALVMQLHEWRLSGRREVWEAIWPELIRYPLIGQGLGDWRVWADQYNLKATLAKWAQAGLTPAQCNAQPPVPDGCLPVVFATLQAHNEPYQLWFELGLIGVALGVCWAVQAWRASASTLRAVPLGPVEWWKPGRLPLERAWVGMLVIAGVNMLGSPVFHLPGQAAMVIFALASVQAIAAVQAPVSGVTQALPYQVEIGAKARNGRKRRKKERVA